MKLVALLMLCAVAAAAPGVQVQNEKIDISQYLTLGHLIEIGSRLNISPPIDIPENIYNAPLDQSPEARNILINALIRQLFAYIRNVINNGSDLFGLPPLDPLVIDQLAVKLPAGIINLDLYLEDVLGTGFGGFVVHRSNLNTRDLSFDLDISIPRLDINAGKYDLLGDFLTAIPLYGKGDAVFEVENFRVRALLYLKQSDDGTSIIIDRIEGANFEIPHFKSKLTGVIGGGDIDAIVNAIVEEVLIDYINRFQGAIAYFVSQAGVLVANPVLNKLDTWRFIAPFV